MGVFGAVFGRRGDAGFSSPLLGVSSGVVGFNVPMLSRLVREKVRPAWPDGGSEREKVRPARSKHPKFGVFALAGRVFSRQLVLRRSWMQRGALQAGCRWGFCSIRRWLSACRRRVRASCRAIPPWGDAGQILEPGCMLCAINFACNSPATLSRFELASLELQRFRRLLKVHATELHAKFLVGVCAFTHGYYSQSPQQGPASRPRS